MQILYLFFGLSLLCGCSKPSQPESQTTVTNQVVEKTLSGIFVNSMQDDRSAYFHYDFRTDGTVIYTAQVIEAVNGSDATRTTTIAGKGVYEVQGDKVSVVYPLVIKTVYDPDLGVVPKDIWQTNEDLMRIDGDDLIHLATIPDGEVTNIDEAQTRFIRKR